MIWRGWALVCQSVWIWLFELRGAHCPPTTMPRGMVILMGSNKVYIRANAIP